MPTLVAMESSGSGAPADSPTAPDYAAYEAAQNAADLARSPSSSDVTADSSSAPSGDQSAPTGARSDAASEPAKTGDKKRDLHSRHGELDADISGLQEKLRLRKALREELATLDRPQPAKPADSQPAKPAEPEWKRYAQHPNAPKEDDFENYADFVTARALFTADQRHAEHATRARLDAESRGRMSETDQVITGFRERLEKARDADPDFDGKVDPDLAAVKPAFTLPAHLVRPANVLLQEVVTSEFSNELMVHFSSDEGKKEWASLLASPTPAAMIRSFGRIEARFQSSGQPAGGEKTPPAKPVTSAPAPPRVLGTKPPADPDRASAAVKAGDYRAYEAAQDAADLARYRR